MDNTQLYCVPVPSITQCHMNIKWLDPILSFILLFPTFYLASKHVSFYFLTQSPMFKTASAFYICTCMSGIPFILNFFLPRETNMYSSLQIKCEFLGKLIFIFSQILIAEQSVSLLKLFEVKCSKLYNSAIITIKYATMLGIVALAIIMFTPENKIVDYYQSLSIPTNTSLFIYEIFTKISLILVTTKAFILEKKTRNLFPSRTLLIMELMLILEGVFSIVWITFYTFVNQMMPFHYYIAAFNINQSVSINVFLTSFSDLLQRIVLAIIMDLVSDVPQNESQNELETSLDDDVLFQ